MRCTAGSRVAEQLGSRVVGDEPRAVRSLAQFRSSWIVEFRCTLPPDSIDRTQHIRLLELRSRTAEFVPAAGIDDDQAAIGILEHVGRVKVEVGAGDKVFVSGREGGSSGQAGRAG